MGYKLTANIDDMSQEEAKAVIRAIIEKHGTTLVEEQVKWWHEQYIGGSGGGGGCDLGTWVSGQQLGATHGTR